MIRSILLASLLVTASVEATAQLQIVSVVNSASFQSGLPSGGALATVFVSGYAGTPGTYPAHPGESIIAYADDFFGTWPPAPIAIPVPPNPPLFQ